MSKTLDEFIEKFEATRLLKENLQANLDNLTDLNKEEKRALMRCNLIMIRQCLQDFGVE